MHRNLKIAGLLAGMTLLAGCSLYEQIEPETEESTTQTPAATTTASQTEASAEETEQPTTAEPVTEEPSSEEPTAEETTAEEETTTEEETTIHFGGDDLENTVEYELREIESFETLPTDGAGNWTDYILNAGPHDEVWVNEEGETINVEYNIENFPGVMVLDPEKAELMNHINEVVSDYSKNDYINRFQMWDLNVQLVCTPKHVSRFVSYAFEGTVYHDKADFRYEVEREYRYYFTVDRMTGTILNLETVYGVQNVYDEIVSGDYTVVRADDKVFETYTNENLARAYIFNPIFDDDLQHERDWYLENGRLHIVIWVGADKGNYCILALHKVPRYI